MEKTPINKAITVPCLHLNEKIQPICDKLIELTKKADNINIVNPFSCWSRINKIRKSIHKLEQEFNQTLCYCHKMLETSVEGGPAILLGEIATWSNGIGISSILKLQNLWNGLAATVDRKTAYCFSTTSFYIAVFSILITVITSIII
jgi:hypothetical protein